MVDLCQWWAEEARREHYAPEGAQCNSGDELELFHKVLIFTHPKTYTPR